MRLNHAKHQWGFKIFGNNINAEEWHTNKTRIDAEINKTLQENLASTFKGVMPANPKLPIHDGDGLRQSGEPYGPECKNHWVITANSNNAPEVVDASCNPIISKMNYIVVAMVE